MDSVSLYREDEDIFNNGEDWNLLGSRDDYHGFPIHAIADGLVVYNNWGYGEAIVLAHQIPNGSIVSVYSHRGEKSPCAVGTVVRKGNVIGKIGPAGSGDAHLHF